MRRQNDDINARAVFGAVRKSALEKIKAEAVRIGGNGTRDGFKLAERLFSTIPELRSA